MSHDSFIFAGPVTYTAAFLYFNRSPHLWIQNTLPITVMHCYIQSNINFIITFITTLSKILYLIIHVPYHVRTLSYAHVTNTIPVSLPIQKSQ